MRTLLQILGALTGFILASLLASLAYLIPFEPAANVLNGLLQIGLVALCLSFYSKKVLRAPLSDFRIGRFSIAPVWWLVALALPALVSGFFLCCVPGTFAAAELTGVQRIATVLYAVFCACLAAGITEEMVFRGVIMKLVEQKLGKTWAILAPSLLFGLLHLTGITEPNLTDILLLMAAGTSVGIMFSLIAYKTGSIWPGALVHGIWNLVIVGGILSIGTAQAGTGIWTYTLLPQNVLLTGGGFGIEASLPALAGYWLVILVTLLLPDNQRVPYQKSEV